MASTHPSAQAAHSPLAVPEGTVDLTSIRTEVDAILYSFLDGLETAVGGPPVLPALIGTVRDFLLAGGKRIRPTFCVLGWHAAGGSGDTAAALRLAASLELFHTAILMHDDVIDRSPTRRGHPTAHHVLAAHRKGDADLEFGRSAAIVLGDLTLAWSDQLIRTAPLTPQQSHRVLPVLDAMRADVNLGQYLDLTATGQPSDDVESALAIARYKTAHYTIERPLQAGAALAEATPEVLEACSAFGIPLGEAFQLRDDLLSVFGDPARVGKSVLSDLREGKHTPLLALALRRATPSQRATLYAHLGDPGLNEADAARLRAILGNTGAPSAVEQMIKDRHTQALAVLDTAPFKPEATAALRTLANMTTQRTT